MRFLYLMLLLSPLSLAAQGLVVDPDYDAERLVRDVFASGQCETIFNIQQIGNNPNGIGFFEAPDSVVGLTAESFWQRET